VPLGTLATIKTVAGPSVISLYNLYPAATVITATARGYSSSQGLDLRDQIARNTLSPGTGRCPLPDLRLEPFARLLRREHGIAIVVLLLVLLTIYVYWP
jgi:HAE1 family hydrophobic/amphiphilic exporter-1